MSDAGLPRTPQFSIGGSIRMILTSDSSMPKAAFKLLV